MTRDELKKKISLQYGGLSKEHTIIRDLVKKAEKWEKHEYEMYGPPSANKKEKKATSTGDGSCAAEGLGGQSQQQKETWLPNDREIFRATWSYPFARAGWIFMAYVVMFGFLGLMFFVMYLMAT